jgi:hypothetical protein
MRTKKNPRDKMIAKQLSDAEITGLLTKVGQLIKEKRSAAGTLEDVSYEIRLSRSALARYEKGGDMQLSNLFKVLYGLNIEFEDFFIELRKALKKR